MINYFKNKLILTIFLIFSVLSGNIYSQNIFNKDDPTKWKYFKIIVNGYDNSFADLINDLQITDLETFSITVDLRDPNTQVIIVGDANDYSSLAFAWQTLSIYTQYSLKNYSGSNKINLENKNISLLDPVKFKNDVKSYDFIGPPRREKYILSTISYINPYIQIFGGKRTGIDIKRSIGFNFGIGNKYSGPFESDQVTLGFNIIGLSLNYSTRFSALNTYKLDPGESDNGFIKQYNNLFTYPNAFELTYTIPFGNFFQIGYYRRTNDDVISGPPKYRFFENGDSAKELPNNILNDKYYINYELRYPVSLLRSPGSELYASYYFKETHIGINARECNVGGSLFDFRMDYMFSSKRNNQFLFELLFSNFAEGLGMASLAIGPSVRITRLENSKIGFHTIFLNARFKIGSLTNF